MVGAGTLSTSIQTHAFGKLILLGEHSVVYGHSALAGAIEDGVTVTVQPGAGALIVPAWKAKFTADSDGVPLARAYAAILKTLGVSAPRDFDLEAQFAIPTGAGLGSSAALSVAVARAIAAINGIENAPVLAAALASETVIHGRPSGLDHTVSYHGGFGVFTRAEGLKPIANGSSLAIVVGHTGRERDTKGRVARVAEILTERESETRARFAAIETLVGRAAKAIERGSLGELGQAMNENQRHLEALEVSCPEIERMCAIAGDAGAVGAKLTGGGGGGCVIAIAPGREAEVERAWQTAGFKSFRTSVGGVSGAAAETRRSEMAR